MPTRLVIVSYATDNYKASQKRLVRSARKIGIDRIVMLRRRHLLRTDFYRRNQATLGEERGAGFWLWKPYVIHETLRSASKDEIVVYSDAAVELLQPLDPLCDLLSEGRDCVLFRNHSLLNRVWTKRDCFVLMGCDSPEYHDADQVNASFILFRTTDASIDLVQEWLRWSEIPEVLTDRPNTCGLPNLEGFIDHRHDQSVLSLLSVKYGIELFRHPSFQSNHLKLPEFRVAGEIIRHPYVDAPLRNSPYGTLLWHHQMRYRALPLRTLGRAKRAVLRALGRSPSTD